MKTNHIRLQYYTREHFWPLFSCSFLFSYFELFSPLYRRRCQCPECAVANPPKMHSSPWIKIWLCTLIFDWYVYRRKNFFGYFSKKISKQSLKDFEIFFRKKFRIASIVSHSMSHTDDLILCWATSMLCASSLMCANFSGLKCSRHGLLSLSSAAFRLSRSPARHSGLSAPRKWPKFATPSLRGAREDGRTCISRSINGQLVYATGTIYNCRILLSNLRHRFFTQRF